MSSSNWRKVGGAGMRVMMKCVAAQSGSAIMVGRSGGAYLVAMDSSSVAGHTVFMVPSPRSLGTATFILRGPLDPSTLEAWE